MSLLQLQASTTLRITLLPEMRWVYKQHLTMCDNIEFALVIKLLIALPIPTVGTHKCDSENKPIIINFVMS